MEMDIKNLNSDIAKRVIDPANLKMGMFVSRIDYEGKKIENRYFISSITNKHAVSLFSKKRLTRMITKVRCYDMIADEFIDFTGAAILKFLRPNKTDFYDYQYTPVGENNNLKELVNNIMLTNDIETSIRSFNTRFDNEYIDMICVMILQAQESGYSVQIMKDMSTQLSDLQKAINIKRQESLDRKVQLLELLVFVGLLGTCIYGMALELTKALKNI